MQLYIGLMSGTSMDGIDAALVSLPEHKVLAALTWPYSVFVRQQLQDILEKESCAVSHLCQLHVLVGREFAAAANALVEQSGYKKESILAIGSHGQTLCHNALATIPYTLQIGCGHTIASLTELPVVTDFRARDLVLKGQGAPLAPLYHQRWFTDSKQSVAVVNIGGIANISLIRPNQAVLGWDIGPGNCLMDAWIQEHFYKPYDRDGSWASEGKVSETLLASFMADPFFKLTAPKSLGREYFSATWLAAHGITNYAKQDVQATLLRFTAQSIADTLLGLPEVSTVYICGGGVHNKQLMSTLRQLLPDQSLQSTAEIGIDPDYVEAMLFAWLASQTIQGIPVDFSAVTGSEGVQMAGAIYPYVETYT